ncbi:hypothetical protein F5887DRAFT_485890 [Amanita rubescens]|nr:hypothetical protein F5887DRAFT_485890 [Amanita rubescens]
MPSLSTRSPCFSTYRLLSDESTVKTTDAGVDDELEILPYLTSESESEPSSRASSPYSESATSSATPYLSDDKEIEPEEIHHRDATFEPLTKIVGIGIDLTLLSAPCNITIQAPMKCEVPRRRIEARKASPPASLGDSDFEMDDISGLDDDEYVPPEEAKHKRALPSKNHKRPSKKPRTESTLLGAPPSPNVTVGNPKRRARNLPSSADAVEDELERISRIRSSGKKKANGRKNKEFSCHICSSRSFTRQSDLVRHVNTHYSQQVKSTVCCGISEEEALERNIDPDHVRTRRLAGDLRIGACGETFSRNDALLRHVRLRSSQCLLLRAGQLIGSDC